MSFETFFLSVRRGGFAEVVLPIQVILTEECTLEGNLAEELKNVVSANLEDIWREHEIRATASVGFVHVGERLEGEAFHFVFSFQYGSSAQFFRSPDKELALAPFTLMLWVYNPTSLDEKLPIESSGSHFKSLFR